MARRGPSRSNKRRKGILSKLVPWAKRFGLWLGVVVFVLWVAAWVILSGALARSIDWTQDQIITATGKAGFTVEALLLEGREHADASFLKVLLNVQPGDPLFSLSPKRAKELLEETEWVRYAHVERRLPGTIYIRLQERAPTALWLKDGKLYLVDEDGAEIKTDALERFTDLMIVSGDGGPQAVYDLSQILRAEPMIAKRVRVAERIEQRRWNLTLNNGLVLKMPEDEDLGHALGRAAAAQEDGALFDRPGLQIVDLRQEDRIVIRNRPGQARIPGLAIPPPARRGQYKGGAI